MFNLIRIQAFCFYQLELLIQIKDFFFLLLFNLIMALKLESSAMLYLMFNQFVYYFNWLNLITIQFHQFIMMIFHFIFL